MKSHLVDMLLIKIRYYHHHHHHHHHYYYYYCYDNYKERALLKNVSEEAIFPAKDMKTICRFLLNSETIKSIDDPKVPGQSGAVKMPSTSFADNSGHCGLPNRRPPAVGVQLPPNVVSSAGSLP